MKVDLDRLHDKSYRLNNLYSIVDKRGQSVKFCLNEAQQSVYDNLHKRNLVLKARQLGMSTFCILYLLDEVLFTRNTSAGIVSYSLPHAQHIFKNIVGHALLNMPAAVQPLGIVAKSTKEISFTNGSNFRVDTSLRGGTTQLVLITEYGKTCARSPVRSDEIIAGTLESVPADGLVLIESTGEGTAGAFTELCLAAAARGNENLHPMDYYLHFFPWYTDPSYALDEPVLLSPAINDYFESLQTKHNLRFQKRQQYWYQKKYELLGKKVQQEYPSTVDEAFISNSDAFYYAEAIQQARREDRIVAHELYDSLLPVYVAADIAVTDYTVLTFFQLHHGEIRIIDYYADTNKGVDHYVHYLLTDKPYIYHTIYLPHDSVKKDGIVVENTYQLQFSRLMAHTSTRIVVLPRTDRNAGIGAAVAAMRKTVISEKRCRDYIAHLQKYRKKWNEQLGRYVDEPLHDEHSDFADSFRYACQAAAQIDRVGSVVHGAMDKHRKAVASRAKQIR